MSTIKPMTPEPYVCTKERPWNASVKGRVHHPDAQDIGECSGGCCDKYKCPNCGHVWLNELPQ